MRLRTASLLALLATAARSSNAFVASSSSRYHKSRQLHAPAAALYGTTTITPTIFEGEPTERAQTTINHREIIRTLPVTSIRGDKVLLDDLLMDDDEEEEGTSIVVFLRSLG